MLAPAPAARFLALWVVVCALAEFIGIGAAALWYGAVMVIIGEPVALVQRTGVWLLATAAAIPEGVVLGGLQGLLLRRVFAGLDLRRWVLATVAVGAVGWAIGSFIPLFIFPEGPSGASFDPPLAEVALFAAMFGVVAGALFGIGQMMAFPRETPRRFAWVWANMAGWAAGLPLIYVAAQVGADLPGWTARITAWMMGGLGAGLCIGLATAVAIRLMREPVARPGATTPDPVAG
jgi:hypothetical protein